LITKSLPPVQNIKQTGRAYVDLELGQTINRITLLFGGTNVDIAAMIGRVLMELNKTPFLDVTGANLVKLNTYEGQNDVADTTLTIDFTEKNARTLGGHYQGAIGTKSGVTSLRLYLDTVAAPADLTIEGIVEESEPTDLGRIRSILTTQINPTAGRYPFLFPAGPTARHYLKRLHILDGDPTHLEVKKNSVNILENTAVALVKQPQIREGFTPVVDMLTYDAVVNRDMSRVINLETTRAAGLSFIPTFGTAEDVTVITDNLVFVTDI